MAGHNDKPEGKRARPAWAGPLSLALATVVMVLAFARSPAIAAAPGGWRTAVLVALLWGSAAGFTHGVGFVPRSPLFRLLLGPAAAWPLLGMALSALLFLL